MAVELNHTIVPARDPQASARFLADILGLPVDPPLAHFTPVTLANGVSLDFDHADHIDAHHYAFQLDDEEFEAAFGRIKNGGITHYADPGCRQPGHAYASKNGRRGTYFRDPNGHLMEILTPVKDETVHRDSSNKLCHNDIASPPGSLPRLSRGVRCPVLRPRIQWWCVPVQGRPHQDRSPICAAGATKIGERSWTGRVAWPPRPRRLASATARRERV